MAKRKTKRTNNFVASALISLGFLLILLGLFSQTQIFFRYLMTFRERPVATVSQNVPTKLSIPAQNISVNVDEGGIINGEWVLSNTDALYLPTSGKLGEGYNTIIYAHNTAKLFGRLTNIRQGQEILIKDKTGKIYKYIVVSVREINPSDLKKLYSTQKNILTLFTCSGWADTKRTIVRAILVK